MAWLLQLLGELREQATPQADHWRTILAPLENHAAERLRHNLIGLCAAVHRDDMVARWTPSFALYLFAEVAQ
jgi:hypothetical protein